MIAASQPETHNPKLETVSKPGLLQNIRQQIANRQNGNSENKIIPLDEEKLQNSWKNFSQQLKENKNPAAQSFDMARLRIMSEGVFEVVTNNNLEQKFIEQERRNLSEFLVREFNNRSLLFSILIDADAAPQEPAQKTMTAKDQYLEIIKQYPLVKELRDKLRMELDY
jgi:DNA polymerase-3 subunit gamma/tau